MSIPSDIWRNLGFVGVASLVTVVALVAFIRLRTRLRFGLVLVTGAVTLALAQPTITQVVQFCRRNAPHVDCVPDQWDRTVNRMAKLFMLLVPSETHLFVVMLIIASGIAVYWRVADRYSRQ